MYTHEPIYLGVRGDVNPFAFFALCAAVGASECQSLTTDSLPAAAEGPCEDGAMYECRCTLCIAHTVYLEHLFSENYALIAYLEGCGQRTREARQTISRAKLWAQNDWMQS